MLIDLTKAHNMAKKLIETYNVPELDAITQHILNSDKMRPYMEGKEDLFGNKKKGGG
jgi:hypothetical protein